MGVIRGLEDLPPREEAYEVLHQDMVESVDVCIIGSGAAGAVLAKELAEAGRSVVLLEKGGYFEGRDMNQRDTDMMPLLWKNGGFNFDDDLHVAIAQGSCLGGSTIINDAVCFDTPPRVRDEWRGLGVDFSDEEWATHLARVNATVHVTEVAEDELNRNNRMLREGAKRIGLREHRPNRRNCVNCMQCGFCHLGCHYETKQNVLVTYLRQALRDPQSDLRVYCNCSADVLQVNGSRVEAVEGRFLDVDGNERYRIRVNARLIMVSAGALASSYLLLKNRIASAVAGRGICLHPAVMMVGEFPYEIKANQGIPMAYTVHDFGVTRTSDTTREAYGLTEGEFLIESIFIPMVQFSMGIPAGPVEHAQLMQKFNHFAMAGIVVRDGNNGRVALSPANRQSVTYHPSARDLQCMATGAEVVGKMWFELGANRIVTSHAGLPVVHQPADLSILAKSILTDPDRLDLASAHPQSGNRIGASASSSVVDPDCRVHGFENLFVCDASVFPTAVGVNPQITVMTVASMVAARIQSQWDARYAAQPVSSSAGDTCSLAYPMYCRRDSLWRLFHQTTQVRPASSLVNSPEDTPTDRNWAFDPVTLEVTNNTRWRGIYPRDQDLETLVELYAGGFWKRFTATGGEVTGVTHPLALPVFARNRARDVGFEAFGNAVQLDYPDAPYSDFHDVLKIIDEHTILGQAFRGPPKVGGEILTFSMARKYPFEFLTSDDHAQLYGRLSAPNLATLEGVWEGCLVSDATWSPPMFRFRYFFDGTTLKNDYLFGGTLAGTATVNDAGDHLEMHDETGVFHDEIRQVTPDRMLGIYFGPANGLARWLPKDLGFFRLDPDRSAVGMPYVLRRIGDSAAYRGFP